MVMSIRRTIEKPARTNGLNDMEGASASEDDKFA